MPPELAGLDICLKQAPEYTREQVLAGIESGKYTLKARGDSFVLLEVYHDDHWGCRCLNIFMAYSPPEVHGFMASMTDEIRDYASKNDCKVVVFQTYASGYQQILDAKKTPEDVYFEPYMWKYLLS